MTREQKQGKIEKLEDIVDLNGYLMRAKELMHDLKEKANEFFSKSETEDEEGLLQKLDAVEQLLMESLTLKMQIANLHLGEDYKAYENTRERFMRMARIYDSKHGGTKAHNLLVRFNANHDSPLLADVHYIIFALNQHVGRNDPMHDDPRDYFAYEESSEIMQEIMQEWRKECKEYEINCTAPAFALDKAWQRIFNFENEASDGIYAFYASPPHTRRIAGRN